MEIDGESNHKIMEKRCNHRIIENNKEHVQKTDEQLQKPTSNGIIIFFLILFFYAKNRKLIPHKK